eukprot:CAMPEP_0181197508 /NCGR_PEP_ID=MMETSP1096-20121128/16086_1 /TAXON_ID=156174 ORGANISM="Chrysochromulina ericina, Strain CCMP281" /NCGR_SAMPLE_ID=MMETSP1096 /ASSEMBLY_ACC=CAM_ASM_000453 /LENGTH=42 /DNA_ID= /DNA_START= /DNA_END= /DNA_ORIENTATION=
MSERGRKAHHGRGGKAACPDGVQVVVLRPNVHCRPVWGESGG